MGFLVGAVMAAFLVSSAPCHQTPEKKPQSGVQQTAMSQVAANPKDKRATAKAIVEKYWSGDARDRYLLLSQRYKANLRRLGITNATKYAAETQPPERIWGTRTYQRVDVSHSARLGRDTAQVVLVIDWEEEGYRGVMTQIFDLVMEDGQWRISNIAH